MTVYYVSTAADLISQISAADAGDTIVLAPGTYDFSANITIDKSLAIVGTSGVTLKTADAGLKLLNIDGASLLSRVTIANISLLCMDGRLSTDAGSAIYVDNAEFVSLVNVQITNFPTGIEFVGPLSGQNYGNRVQNVIFSGCDRGLVFEKQNNFLATKVTETSPQTISVGTNFAVYGKLGNGAVSLSNISSLNHTAGYAYQFESGVYLAENIQAESAEALIYLTGVSGSFVGLDVIGWNPTTSDQKAIRVTATNDLQLSNLRIYAVDGKTDLYGIHIDATLATMKTVVTNASFKCKASTGNIYPYYVTGADNAAFIACAASNSDAPSGGKFTFTFDDSDYGYVFCPTIANGTSGNKFIRFSPSTNNCVATLCTNYLAPSYVSGTSDSILGTNDFCDVYAGSYTLLSRTEMECSIDASSVTAGDKNIRLPPGAYLPVQLTQSFRVTNASPSGKLVKIMQNDGTSLDYAWLLSKNDWVKMTNMGSWMVGDFELAPRSELCPPTLGGSQTLNYSKPPLASRIRVTAAGGGGGGGTGGRSSSDIFGGGGGAAGAFVTMTFLASDVTAAVNVQAGNGGTGPTGISSDGNGTDGGDGGPSNFGSLLSGRGGRGGKGGNPTAATSGANAPAYEATLGISGAGGWNSTNANSSIGGDGVAGGGGAGGKGATSGVAGGVGGVGSAPSYQSITGGAAGTTAGAGGSAPATVAANAVEQLGGAGGGGGAGASGTGGTGGAGGFPAGGGGGGGSSKTSGTSGGGGVGGVGRVWITTFF